MSAKEPSTTAAASSVEVISNNDDLLLEILILLPAKSLIRFKSVSKHWHSLISDASFRHLHARRYRMPQTSFLLRSYRLHWFHFNPTRKNLVPFNFTFNEFEVCQSCNGLLLLERGYNSEVYYVYNPTTGESRNLWLPNNGNLNFLCLLLAFDPLKSPHYKAICLRNSKTSSLVYYIEVYHSETHEWKRDDKPYQMPKCVLPLRRCVYSNDFTYSLSSWGSIFCFDTENLVCGDPIYLDVLSATNIIESFGHVHIISYTGDDLVVHEITEKNGERSFLFQLYIGRQEGVIHDKFVSLGVIRGERKDNYLVFLIPGKKIMAYHFYERRIEELLDFSTQKFYEDGCFQFGPWHTHQFVESLAPV